MATPNIIPRGNKEGNIGLPNRRWDKVYADGVDVNVVNAGVVNAEEINCENLLRRRKYHFFDNFLRANLLIGVEAGSPCIWLSNSPEKWYKATEFGHYCIANDSDTDLYLPDNVYRAIHNAVFETAIKVSNSNIVFIVGLYNEDGEGFYFVGKNGLLKARNFDGNNENIQDLLELSTEVIYQLRIETDLGGVKYFVNDVLMATLTSCIYEGAVSPRIIVEAGTLYLYYVECWQYGWF
ncbi:MAG: hypothetical protein ABIK73_06755 [candidate division WOR-3 bacterium]